MIFYDSCIFSHSKTISFWHLYKLWVSVLVILVILILLREQRYFQSCIIAMLSPVASYLRWFHINFKIARYWNPDVNITLSHVIQSTPRFFKLILMRLSLIVKSLISSWHPIISRFYLLINFTTVVMVIKLQSEIYSSSWFIINAINNNIT